MNMKGKPTPARGFPVPAWFIAIIIVAIAAIVFGPSLTGISKIGIGSDAADATNPSNNAGTGIENPSSSVQQQSVQQPVVAFRVIEKDSSEIAGLHPDAVTTRWKMETLYIYEDDLHFAGDIILKKSYIKKKGGVNFYFKDSLVEINAYCRAKINNKEADTEISVFSYNQFPVSSKNRAATQFEGEYMLYHMSVSK